MVNRSVSLVPSVWRWQLLQGKGRTEEGVLRLLTLLFPKPVRGSLSLGTKLSAQGFLSPSAPRPLPAVSHHPPTPPPLLQLRPDAFCALLVCVGCTVGV